MIDAYFALRVTLANRRGFTRRDLIQHHSFHYQRADGAQVFRYDNTDHYPELPTAPHHKHLAEGVPPQPTTPPDLALVLKEIELLIAANR